MKIPRRVLKKEKAKGSARRFIVILAASITAQWVLLSSAAGEPFFLLGDQEPFWRGTVVVAPYTTNGFLLVTSPDYLRDASLSFPVTQRPYEHEIPSVDDVFFVRPLGGLQDAQGNPLPEFDFVYRDGGDLAFRTNLITAQLQPYLDVGYSNFTVVLDNIPWCLPETPLTGTFGQRAPAADLNEWYETVQALCIHLKYLLGESHANQLRFRVGTESDWPQRWSGTEADFFDHYDYSSAAVESILPSAEVGPFNKIGGAVFDGSFVNVGYTNLAQHCATGINAKTGAAGIPFGWASASYYYNETTANPDESASNLEQFFEAVEVVQPGAPREVHEFGVVRDSTGLVSYESGSRGAALIFHTLSRFARMGIVRSKTAWDKSTFEKFTNADDDQKLLAGHGWAMNLMEHIFQNGETALLPVASISSTGTLWQAVASSSPDGSRLLLGVSAFNPDPMVAAPERVRIEFPSSFFTPSANRNINSIRYDRHNAIYEIIRNDLKANGLLEPAYDLPHRPVSKLDHITTGWDGKNHIAANWTTGSNYQSRVQANLILEPDSEMDLFESAPGEYAIELELEPDSVVVLEIRRPEFVWDGGASTAHFGDAANWDPNSSAFSVIDTFTISNGASVMASSNFSVGALILQNGSGLNIETGSVFSINLNNTMNLSDGMLTVNGTLDFGSNRWNTGGVGGMMNIVINGTLQGTGNFYAGAQMNLNVDVNGTLDHKLSSLGSTFNQSRSQVISVNGGGIFDVFGGVTLLADSTAETAIQLAGGTMNFSGSEYYTYSSLVLSNNNDGIIFTDIASQLTLEGNRASEVNTWISDGALSSAVGAMTVSYDGGLDKTMVGVEDGYQAWAGGWGVGIGSETNDHDGDLYANLYEYAMGGDPTNRGDWGEVPIFRNDAGALAYIHAQRTDDTRLIYHLETTDDLLSGAWTNAGYSVVGTNVTGGTFDYVTNAIQTTVDETFIRLMIEK